MYRMCIGCGATGKDPNKLWPLYLFGVLGPQVSNCAIQLWQAWHVELCKNLCTAVLGYQKTLFFLQVSAEAGEMTGGVFAVAAALGVGVLALNKIAPIILPSPDDLGKPEAEAEAKRLAALEATVGNPRKSGEEEEDEAEKDTVFAAVHSTRKR